MMDFTNLKYYDELTPESQAQARVNIMAAEYAAHLRHIDKARTAWRDNMHKAINDRNHTTRIMNGSIAQRKAKELGSDYVATFLRCNRTILTACGAYVWYVQDFGVFSGGVEYIPTPEEQQALRQPYIDINDRGPSFYRELYAKIDRVKRNMIKS